MTLLTLAPTQTPIHIRPHYPIHLRLRLHFSNIAIEAIVVAAKIALMVQMMDRGETIQNHRVHHGGL